MDTWLVTGGAGFIGVNFVRAALAKTAARIVVYDRLTYAGHRQSLADLEGSPRFGFVHADVADPLEVEAAYRAHAPVAVVHFAAESHVDRSIEGPREFVRTNVIGTQEMLEGARAHVTRLSEADRERFRFVQVSTDEVYGSLGATGRFTEETPYAPNSPYAASKAAADHLARAWHETYGLATVVTNCSNNYGPYQFPEKLIPLMILNALDGKPLPVYGKGLNVRDWLYVEDHCEAIWAVIERGRLGETYNIGGNCELTNIDVVQRLCRVIAEETGRPVAELEKLVTYVKDRPGHDLRYAIDAGKTEKECGWAPRHSFDTGLRATVRWYIEHREWVDGVRSGDYLRWIERNYGKRASAAS